MKIVDLEIGETVDNKHDLRFNDVPTLLQEDSRETVRARSFVPWKFVDRNPDLLLGEKGTQVREVTSRRQDAAPIEVLGARGASQWLS